MRAPISLQTTPHTHHIDIKKAIAKPDTHYWDGKVLDNLRFEYTINRYGGDFKRSELLTSWSAFQRFPHPVLLIKPDSICSLTIFRKFDREVLFFNEVKPYVVNVEKRLRGFNLSFYAVGICSTLSGQPARGVRYVRRRGDQ